MRLIRYMGLYLLYSPMFAIFATFSHTRLCLPPSSTWADLFSKWPGRPNRFVRGFVRGYVQLCAGHFAPKYPLGQDGLLSVWPLSTGIDTIENRDLPPCYKLHPCISTLPWGQLCYPHVVPKHATNNTNAEYRPPMWSVLLAICRATAVKKQTNGEHWSTWSHFCYPYRAPTCVKSITMLNINPFMRSVLPISRSNACKNKTNVALPALPWSQFCYPYVVPVRAKTNTNIEYRPFHGVSFVTHMFPMCEKTLYGCWISTLPWG